mmetsp:Transcript_58086/g.109439  ORF Transcript_58086/g.109439 Transcript_58086/m.109439 type:complete len:230 (-) Transcript_58086:405-1094(-)
MHFAAGPLRFANIRAWPRFSKSSASLSNISQPVRSTWLIALQSTMIYSILSNLAPVWLSQTSAARRQNSFIFLALAKLSLASMRTTTALLSRSAFGKFRISRQLLSGSLPQTTKFGLANSCIVLRIERTKPTRSPNFTLSPRDTTKVATMTRNSFLFACHATLKSWMLMTPIAPWMMIGAKDEMGNQAMTGRSRYTERKTRIDEIAHATSDVAPIIAFTAVLEKDPVTG